MQLCDWPAVINILPACDFVSPEDTVPTGSSKKGLCQCLMSYEVMLCADVFFFLRRFKFGQQETISHWHQTEWEVAIFLCIVLKVSIKNLICAFSVKQTAFYRLPSFSNQLILWIWQVTYYLLKTSCQYVSCYKQQASFCWIIHAMLNHVPVCDVKPKLSVAYLPVGSLQSPVVTLNRSVSAVFQQWQHEQNVLNTDHRVCQDKCLSIVCVRRCVRG